VVVFVFVAVADEDHSGNGHGHDDVYGHEPPRFSQDADSRLRVDRL
jgi:hypothetical protein